MEDHPLRVIKYAKATLIVKTPWLAALDPCWQKPRFSHQFQKNAEKRWECQICGRDWASKSKTKCVGVKAIDFGEAENRGLLTIYKAQPQNLKLKEGAVPVAHYNRTPFNPYWDLLFEPESFEIAFPQLPQIITTQIERRELRSMDELRKLDKRPQIGSIPAGCTDKSTREGSQSWTLLYREEDCVPGYESEYVTKTRLMKTYLLSDGWMYRLGAPDFTAPNPHNPRNEDAQMLLYSRERVEQFLAENAEEYAEWLAGREKRVAAAKQAAAPKLRIKEQTQKCLQCASAHLSDRGFLCVIYPMGWAAGVPQEQFCPDWHPTRNNREY